MVNGARKTIFRADNDGFYTHNSELFMFVGTMIMWICLAHLYSGFHLKVTSDRYQAELAYINCLAAGASGGLTALAFKKLLDIKFLMKMDGKFEATGKPA
mmetsp:Transcript_36330/g.35219  ORF Transcript_36330/g.35219 Transcript_36330/m.35219 type:complete len:100 (+) Transcript_36330:760-1059(+)